MESIATVVGGLIVVNGLLLLAIAILLLENPFRLGILAAVTLANCAAFVATALATSDRPGAALSSFGQKALPFVVIGIALVALFCTQSLGLAAKKRGR